LPLPVTVQLQASDSITCFEAVYDAPDVIRNQPNQFKAKAR